MGAEESRMAAQAGRFTDDKYVNWIKDTLALIYLKEGLEVFVDCQSAVFHRQLGQLSKLGNQTCSYCSWQLLSKGSKSWIVKCPTGVCQKWLDLIISHHTNRPLPALATRNSDPQLWTTDDWEVMKLYQAKGCHDQHSAKDTDIAGILAVIGNCEHFHRFINHQNLIVKIREIRNRCMHSPDLRVETVDLGTDLQTMLQFLRGLMSLSVAEQDAVQNAIEKIQELQTGLLDLSLNKELELRALKLKQNGLDADLICVKQVLEVTSEKARTTEDAVNEIQANLGASNAKRAELETDLKAQREKMKEFEETLQAVQNSFNRFLQANHLEKDMTRLSTTQERHSQIIKKLETQTQHIDVTIRQQQGELSTLYQRQDTTESVLQKRLEESQAQRKMLDTQQGRLVDVEARLQNQAASENKEITDRDITALQTFLRNYYRTMRLSIPNPVVSEELGIDCLYVDPDIKVLRETTYPDDCGLVNVEDKPTLANVSQCRQLFYTKDYKCRQIYLTGDAGLGKSIFCKHLVDLWCKAGSEIVVNDAHSSEDSDSENNGFKLCECCFMSKVFFMCKSKRKKRFGRKDNAEKKRMEDLRIMSEFKLLFYITLRESPEQYNVADMIDSQILQEDEEMKHLKASLLLKKVPCLVVIDGLDEWVCPADAKIPRFVKPGIPGRDWLNNSNVFLSTTRSWKFDVLQLTSKEVDKHVELVGFNGNASVTLCSKITELLKKKERVERIKGNLQTELRRKRLVHLSNIPVILTQLVCLWFDRQDLGESQIQLYCNMLEMLLKRADKNLPDQTYASTSEAGRKEMWLPQCFLNHKHCQEHHLLLFSLCKVAFEALFDQKREHALVFDSSQLEILGVGQNNVDMCLKSGILTQSKVLGKWSGCEKKMSFLHKKLQEFLAALFIACENEESIISRVKQFCTSVESVLEMSQVFMFVSGINYEVANQLLEELMTRVVLKESRLHQNRHTLYGTALPRSVQTCILECVGEATCNGHVDPCLPLEDIVIDSVTISTCLERLLAFNTAAIKYVYIKTWRMTPDTVERVMCQLQDTHRLQKLYLHDFSGNTNIQYLCKTLENNKDSLTCLQLQGITLTEELYDAVCRALTHVTALGLNVTLTHEQREQLLLYMSQAQHIRQLKMMLFCTDHGYQCRARIDLSALTQLHTLDLWYMYVNHLPLVMPGCVERVTLWFVTLSESQLRQFIHAHSSTSHTLKVKLDYVTVTEGSDSPVDLTDLKHNPKLVVTWYQHNASCKWWFITFHTKQQMTTASGNQI